MEIDGWFLGSEINPERRFAEDPQTARPRRNGTLACAFDPELVPEASPTVGLDVAERLQVPADYPAATLLVMLAGALGRRALIRPQIPPQIHRDILPLKRRRLNPELLDCSNRGWVH